MGEYVNSTTARFDKSFVSCGVMECHHLPKGPQAQTVFAIANALYHKANPRPAAYVIFSDVIIRGQNSRGEQLAEALRRILCGKLVETAAEVNPRTGNTIKLWVLHLDHENFRKWYREEAAERVTEN